MNSTSLLDAHPSPNSVDRGPRGATRRPARSCDRCRRVSRDVELVAVSDVATTCERYLDPSCIERTRLDPLVIVEALDDD